MFGGFATDEFLAFGVTTQEFLARGFVRNPAGFEFGGTLLSFGLGGEATCFRFLGEFAFYCFACQPSRFLALQFPGFGGSGEFCCALFGLLSPSGNLFLATFRLHGLARSCGFVRLCFLLDRNFGRRRYRGADGGSGRNYGCWRGWRSRFGGDGNVRLGRAWNGSWLLAGIGTDSALDGRCWTGLWFVRLFRGHFWYGRENDLQGLRAAFLPWQPKGR